MRELSQNSKWRVKITKELSKYYTSHNGIKMIVLGGSPSRNLSDEFSDLDIVLYWDKIDYDWLNEIPLKETKGNRIYFRKYEEYNSCIEHYFFGNLKADFAHSEIDSWNEWVDKVINKYEADSGMIKSISGFLDSIPIYNEELINEFKSKLQVYPDQLAINVIKNNAGFFVKDTLLNQGLKRKEYVYFYDGLCIITKKILNMLGAINRVFYSADEPRWLEYELNKMEKKPDDILNKIDYLFNGDREKAHELLYELLFETLRMVDKEFPELKTQATIERILNFTVKGCKEKPETI